MSEDNDGIRMVNVRPKDVLSVTQYSSWTIHIHLGKWMAREAGLIAKIRAPFLDHCITNPN